MKIVLTGAGGQLGQEWKLFLQNRSEVNLYAFDSSGLDITDTAKVEDTMVKLQPDLLINCAAFTDVDGAEKHREKAALINHRAVKSLAEIALDLDIKLVHFSTDYVFPGLAEDYQHLPHGYPEEHKKDPVNWYGQTKWEGEKSISTSGCSHLIIRVSWLCGQFGNNFVKTMLRLGNEKQKLSVVDDQLGSPTFTEDVVQNVYRLITQNREGTYHLSSKGIISWADFAEAIFEIAGKKVAVERIGSEKYPTEAKRPAFSKLDTRKIEQEKDIKLTAWREGLQHLISQLKN